MRIRIQVVSNDADPEPDHCFWFFYEPFLFMFSIFSFGRRNCNGIFSYKCLNFHLFMVSIFFKAEMCVKFVWFVIQKTLRICTSYIQHLSFSKKVAIIPLCHLWSVAWVAHRLNISPRLNIVFISIPWHVLFHCIVRRGRASPQATVPLKTPDTYLTPPSHLNTRGA